MIEYELRESWSPRMRDFWIDLYRNGEKINGFSGALDKGVIKLIERSVARDPEGGIIDCFPMHKEPYTVKVEPCPTGHANIKDDYMGGTLCGDCRAMW